MAALLNGGQRFGAEHFLESHINKAYSVLEKWLEKNGWVEHCTRYVEVSFAYSPSRMKARRCAPPDPVTHIYPDLQPDEIGGTADLVIVPEDPYEHGRDSAHGHFIGSSEGAHFDILVLDHKTGMWGDFSRPNNLAQLSVLGAAATLCYGQYTYIPAIFHAPKDGLPIVYEGERRVVGYGPEKHAALKTQLSRIGDGYMRPGAHCKYCPVRTQCPTQHAELISKAGELVEKATLVGSELVLVGNNNTLSQEERVGRLHLLMSRFRQLDEAAVREMKRLMKDDPNLEPIRPDGKTLKLDTRKVERVNKEKLLATYGEDALRAAGVLEEKEEVVLWAK